MDLNYSDEQTMLRDGVARFIAQEYGFEKRAAQLASGETLKHWAAFADMGWLLVPFAEGDGGLSGRAVDVALVMEEFGRGLVVEPYVANTVLAGGIIARLANEQQRHEWLAPLMAGELRLAVAITEPDGRYRLAHVGTRAEEVGGAYRVNGQKAVVLGADVADRIVVPVRTAGAVDDEEGITLLLVDADAPGLERQPYRTVDGQGAAELVLNDVMVPASDSIGGAGCGLPALAEVVDNATLAVCAEAVGAMQAALEITLDYTKTRKQFGRPVASFQALQHRMVDMLIEIEQARSIVLKACLALDAGDNDPARTISAAKVRVGKAARRVGEEAVQMHGGIGIAEEYSIGHYLKRLTAIQFSFGSTDFHMQRYLTTSA